MYTVRGKASDDLLSTGRALFIPTLDFTPLTGCTSPFTHYVSGPTSQCLSVSHTRHSSRPVRPCAARAAIMISGARGMHRAELHPLPAPQRSTVVRRRV